MKTVSSYNNIDPQLYFKLRQARVTVYNIIRNRAFFNRGALYAVSGFCKKLQKKLDTDRVDLMDYEIQAYAQADYLQDRLKDLKKKYGGKIIRHMKISRIFLTALPAWKLSTRTGTSVLKETADILKTVAVRRTMNGS